MSHWLSNADFLLPGVFLQALILRPLWPVFVRDADEIRSRAAVILCVLPFLLWDWLSGSVGSASAALICALALALVMVVAGRQRFVLFALVSCAGFLAVSALAQQEPPRGVLDPFETSGPDIDFNIALPAAEDTTGLSMTAKVVVPGMPTLFGCPAQVDVRLSVIVSAPKSESQENKLVADLARSPYTLDVSGVTRITDSRLVPAAERATFNGRSRVIYASQSRGGTHTEWRATGFDAGLATSSTSASRCSPGAAWTPATSRSRRSTRSPSGREQATRRGQHRPL